MHVLFNGEHARRVIQLFANVFADALKFTAAGTLSALGLVMNDGTRKLRRQQRTFRLLAWFVRCQGGTKGFQLGADGLEVSMSKSSSKLLCAGLICSLRLANLWRLRMVIS